MKQKSINRISILILLSLVISMLAACAPSQPTAAPAATQPAEAASPTEPQEASKEFKFALILPGSIQDADFNTNGYMTVQAVKNELGIEATYSEQVAVSDSERVSQEYISSGYNIIGYYGGQFRNTVLNLADKYPDVTFVILTGGQSPDLELTNVWNIARKWYMASYPFGVMAAKSTKTKKVGYIAGLKMADYVGALNAVNDAIQATDPSVELVYAFVGDFNDPVKTRQIAESMISEGVDFIIGHQNLGFFGIMEAAKAAPNQVLISGLYSDKIAMAPENYTAALLIQHDIVFVQVIEDIMAGTPGGYFEMKPGSGMDISQPIHNVSDEVSQAVLEAEQKIINGEIVLEEKNQETP
jgi:basic membrane lipoprotein Med (substrate-binding protein (PBP1-ABC) superfamily)